jgi:putative ABC transport system ATP-binding protein
VFELTGIERRYADDVVVSVPAWRAEAGEQWLLAGASGSGKSTILHVLAGLTRPTTGRVIVGDTDLGTLHASALDRWRGRTIGFVPQRLHLVAALDVRDNLRLAQTFADATHDDARIRALLEALQIGDLARRFPRELSHGQAQRVAVARAVVNRPRLLLADEPTASLDDAHAVMALELLRTQAIGVGATLVVASHDARVRAALPRTYQLQMNAVPTEAAA